ncbi:hypothetical protein CYLTODRAFT_426869 [Cylindrobasidium torrendii FP15055 ss-10]|uniref:Uncharacterized protein n=1 Tax=Cylindrobasidium torrendii FP15055 ss-10 TaxID=1314674 RepID=A0A0D7AWA9_9AGAR|nr:hypothetical protein CYLTODRAFT_426869 [Cylindrobasidium torrendii FP15055 ss-10]
MSLPSDFQFGMNSHAIQSPSNTSPIPQPVDASTINEFANGAAISFTLMPKNSFFSSSTHHSRSLLNWFPFTSCVTQTFSDSLNPALSLYSDGIRERPSGQTRQT